MWHVWCMRASVKGYKSFDEYYRHGDLVHLEALCEDWYMQ